MPALAMPITASLAAMPNKLPLSRHWSAHMDRCVRLPEDGTTGESVATPPAKPARLQFRKRFAVPRLPPDVSDRHGRATTSAFLVLGDAVRATAFMNSFDDVFAGRPIDIAGENAAGLAAVQDRLRAIDVRAE